MILKPKLVVLDEPTSALDRSVQKQIVELLRKLQADHELSYLFISHDLSVVRVLCDDVAILHHGEVVEYGAVARVFGAPQHAYTQQLLAAIPLPDIEPGWLDDAPPAVTSQQQGSAA
jgi:peptide/nickel transport system ATP-binding protein